MLLALLPLAGWAAEHTITVTPYVVSKAYGTADPGTAEAFPATKFKLVDAGGSGFADEAAVSAANILKMVRLENGETVGTYAYTFQETVTKGDDTYTIICTQNGALNITPKAFKITATAASKTYDGTAAPTADLDYTLKVGDDVKTWDEILAASDLDGENPKDGLFSIARESDGANATVYPNDIVPVWNDNVNYEVTIEKANYTINPKPLTGVNFTQAAYEITYGETPSFEFALQDAEESLVGSETLAANFGAKLTTNADLPTDVTAATAIKVVCTTGNYTLTNASDAATFAVLAKPATSNDLTFTIANNLKYQGANIVPTYDGNGKTINVKDGETALIKDASYTVAFYSDETCETAATIKNAATYYAKFTLDGNYTGTKIVSFAVAPVELTVTAENKVKAYGAADPAFTVTYSGWVGDDATAADADLDAFLTGLDGFTAPTVTRADKEAETGEDVGDHALTVDGAVVPNYTLKYVAGKLTIGQMNIEISCVNKSKAWKGTDPALEYTVLPAGAKELLTSLPIVTRAEGEEIGHYAITATGAAADAEKYNITYVDGDFEITKATLTITAKDQTVAQGAAAINTEVSEATVTVTGFVNGESIADLAVAGDEFTTPLTISKAAAADLNTAGEYAAGIEVAGLASEHYEFDYNFGTLNVIGAGMDLTLTRDEYCLDKIIEAEGEAVNVKFGDRALEAQKWNSFVLPFEVSAAKLSEAFGYAVFNVIDEVNSNESNVRFKLYMGTIPANTPFLMKTAEAKNTADVTINSVTIDIEGIDGETGLAAHEIGTTGNYFIGNYKKVAMKANNSFPVNDAWKKGKASGVNLKPLAAYLEYPEGSPAPTITLEEIDGTVTAIESINADGVAIEKTGWYTINGIKLENAPTEKGVYIRNGKKMVIK